jgi:ABC-2 type transport system permease protein
MKNFRHVFRYEFMRNLRRKGYLFATLGLPLIGLILTLGFQFFMGRGTVDLLPEEEAMEAFDFGATIDAGFVDLAGLSLEGDESSLTAFPDEAAARAALDSGAIEVYYIIAPDYMESGDVTVAMPKLQFNQTNTGELSRLLLDNLARELDDELLFERLSRPVRVEQVNLQVSAPDADFLSEGRRFFIVYIYAFMLMMGLLVTSSYLMQSVIEERESRIIEILVSSVKPGELLTGKIMAMGLLGVIQIIAWQFGMLLTAQLGSLSLIGPALGFFIDFNVPGQLLVWLLIYFVLAYLMYAAIYSIIGVLSNSTREGSQYTVIFVLPLVSPLWFISVFISTPQANLPVILSLIPFTSPLAMASRLAISDVPPEQLLLSVALLALTMLAALWLAGRAFRMHTLLAGKMPKIWQLPKLLLRG